MIQLASSAAITCTIGYAAPQLHILLLCSLFISAPAASAFVQTEFTWTEESLPIESVVHTAFVQTGDELHYFKERSQREREMFGGGSADSRLDPKTFEEDPKARKKDEHRMLEIRPSSVNFGKNNLGEGAIKHVRVCNQYSEVVRIDAILAESTIIQTSYLNGNTLTPNECTDIRLVFVPRNLGHHAGRLLIHATDGVYAVPFAGDVVTNTFRLSPFLGMRMAVNGTLRREFRLHNPFPYDVRILEVASSGGGLFVQMPNGADATSGADSREWDLRPFETKHIVDFVLVPKEEINATAFAIIRGEKLMETGNEALPPIYFHMPFESDVTSDVFPSTDLLDFGLVQAGQKSPRLLFAAYSTLGKFIEFEVERMTMDPEDVSIFMEYATHPPLRLHSGRIGQPGAVTPLVKVQMDTNYLYLNMSATGLHRFNGKISAQTRQMQRVTVPYTISVYMGKLVIEGNDGCIHNGLSANTRRAIRVRSHLPLPVAVYNITLPANATNHFTVQLFSRTVTLFPGELAPVFLLKYNKKVPTPDFTMNITLHTNLSDYNVPIYFFDGKVSINLLTTNQKAFDFGLVDRNDTRTIQFEVRNPNPASISLHNIRLPYPNVTRIFIVCQSIIEDLEDGVPLCRGRNERREVRMGIDLAIPPRSVALLEMLLRVGLDGHVVEGEFVAQTEFETRIYPITYEVGRGKLLPIPSVLRFGPSHPGKVSYRTLQIFNSFHEDMVVTEMRTLPEESLLQLEGLPVPPLSAPLLRSGRFTNLGRVLLMPPYHCSHEYCYLGLNLPNPANLPADLLHASLNDPQWFVHGLTLPTNLADIDSYLYRRAKRRFDALVSSGRNLVNTSIILDTNRAKHIQVPVTTEMVWPRLLSHTSVQFPLTAVGNFTIVNLTLTNPTRDPIVVQLIPLVIYPDAEAFLEQFRDYLATPLTQHVETNETLMFSLRDTELFTLRPESPVPAMREELEKTLQMNVPRFTLSAILHPHMKMRIRLGFLPSDYNLKSSLLIIRNNLTMVEPVVIYGRGARIGVEIEGRKSRGRDPLLFEIRNDHLLDCDNPKRLTHRLQSTLTVRRPFTLTNTGEVPFSVVNMSISGHACENRGFRILNCFPFRLQPNETYSLDVAYTPDFLSTTNEADLQLYMHMNGSAWVFPLAATLPEGMLSRCHAALPRAHFEPQMYYLCIIALVFCLICVLACSYLEADRAVVCAFRQHYAVTGTIFDLNAAQPDEAAIAAAAVAAKKKSHAATPTLLTELRARNDAPTHTKVFYWLANTVLFGVHKIWRVTAVWRDWFWKDSDASEGSGSGRKGQQRGRKQDRNAAAQKAQEAQRRAQHDSQRLLEVQRVVDEPEGRGRKSTSSSGISNGDANGVGEKALLVPTASIGAGEESISADERPGTISGGASGGGKKKNKKKANGSAPSGDEAKRNGEAKTKEEEEEERELAERIAAIASVAAYEAQAAERAAKERAAAAQAHADREAREARERAEAEEHAAEEERRKKEKEHRRRREEEERRARKVEEDKARKKEEERKRKEAKIKKPEGPSRPPTTDGEKKSLGRAVSAASSASEIAARSSPLSLHTNGSHAVPKKPSPLMSFDLESDDFVEVGRPGSGMFARPPSSTQNRDDSDAAPEWDDVVAGENVDEVMRNMVEESARAFSREGTPEHPFNESGGKSAGAIGSEKKRREDEERRKAREQLERELISGDLIPQLELPDMSELIRESDAYWGSIQPSLPAVGTLPYPASFLTGGFVPPPGFESMAPLMQDPTLLAMNGRLPDLLGGTMGGGMGARTNQFQSDPYSLFGNATGADPWAGSSGGGTAGASNAWPDPFSMGGNLFGDGTSNGWDAYLNQNQQQTTLQPAPPAPSPRPSEDGAEGTTEGKRKGN